MATIEYKYKVGDTVYSCDYVELREECELCHGEGFLQLIDGRKIICSNCLGQKTVLNKPALRKYVVLTSTVQDVHIDISSRDVVNIVYTIDNSIHYYQRREKNLYSTSEEAEKGCEILNNK